MKTALPLKRPYVLLIIVDDLRQRVDWYGILFIKTPNIDLLAARGLRFDRACDQYAAATPAGPLF